MLCGSDLNMWGRESCSQLKSRINHQKFLISKLHGNRNFLAARGLDAAEKELSQLLKSEEEFWK